MRNNLLNCGFTLDCTETVFFKPLEEFQVW
jgi:hypothetical protein